MRIANVGCNRRHNSSRTLRIVPIGCPTASGVRAMTQGCILFPDIDTPSSIFPEKRLEHIQRWFLRALGRDPDYGTKEIKRRFLASLNGKSCNDKDSRLQQAFLSWTATMQTVLAEANASRSHDKLVSDDGMTRVVSVQYSEKLIDSMTGED